MMDGQLYLVYTTATLPSEDIVRSRYIVQSHSAADVHNIIKYIVDITVYDDFTITKVEKIKGHVYAASSKIERVKRKAEFIDKEGNEHHQRNNQKKNRSTFAIGIGGTMKATDELHAMRKLGTYLINHGTGHKEYKLPMNTDAVVRIEPMGESDSTVVSKIDDTFPKLLVFQGGAANGNSR